MWLIKMVLKFKWLKGLNMYQLLDKGQAVPCTRVDTIEEAIEMTRAFEQEWRRIRTILGKPIDASPYTIDLV